MVKVKYFNIDNVVRFLKSLGSGMFATFTALPLVALGRFTMGHEMIAVTGIIGLLSIGTYALSKGWANKKFWGWK